MGEPLLACLHRRIQLVHERGIQMPEAMKPAPRGTVMPSTYVSGRSALSRKALRFSSREALFLELELS
jgi:hypothetical protein